MEKENKKKRFIEFFDKTIELTSDEMKEKISQQAKNRPLILKIRIKDLNLTRIVIFSNNSSTITSKTQKKTDCTIMFDKAKTFHQIMSGRILPYNINLIGKFKIIYNNERGKILGTVFIPAKNNYCKIIKGTRFTLKTDDEPQVEKSE